MATNIGTSSRGWGGLMWILAAGLLWQSCTLKDLRERLDVVEARAVNAQNAARQAQDEVESSKSDLEELRIELGR